VGLAEKLGIPPLIIGLTVVSFGTSAPEMVISVQAAINGFPGISLGNVIGSNIANVLLVLGIPGLIYATTCKVDNLTKNTLFMVFVTFVFMGFAFMGTFQLWHGLVLLGLLAGYVYMAAVDARKKGDVTEEGLEDEVGAVPHSTWLAVLFLLLGLVGLPIAAHFTVDSATQIARVWGISEALIGLTIVAVGTSLPELAATAVAAYKKQSGLALGNVVGSNIFNILSIVGITAIVTPISVPERMIGFDMWVMLACALLLVPLVLRKATITKLMALGLVLLYVGYVVAAAWVETSGQFETSTVTQTYEQLA
jgi:cation:H+ antiporter